MAECRDANCCQPMAEGRDLHGKGTAHPTGAVMKVSICKAMPIKERVLQLLSGRIGDYPVLDLSNGGLDNGAESP